MQFDLSVCVCGFTDHFLIALLPSSISVSGPLPTISYATPYYLLHRDKLSTQTVAPDPTRSLPSDINDAVQRHDDILINLQLSLFWHALFEMQACQGISAALWKALRGKQRGIGR